MIVYRRLVNRVFLKLCLNGELRMNVVKGKVMVCEGEDEIRRNKET